MPAASTPPRPSRPGRKPLSRTGEPAAVGFKLTRTMRDRLRRAAKRHGQSMSAAIREAITDWLAEYG